MTIPSDPPRTPPRAFQFRIGTLLIATAWAALISLGLRTPNPFLSGIIAILTLLSVLTSVIVAVYRSGRTRSASIGFLVFCGGYLAYAGPHFGISAYIISSPAGELFNMLATAIHGKGKLVDDSIRLPSSLMPIGPPYQLSNFLSICHLAIAALLGVVGSIAAQFLYATQRREADSSNNQ